MKVIIDTNLWISFLIGHQAQLVRRMLTDLRFDVYVCSRLIEEIRDVASRDKIRKYVSEADLGQYNQARIMKLADFKAMMQYQ